MKKNWYENMGTVKTAGISWPLYIAGLLIFFGGLASKYYWHVSSPLVFPICTSVGLILMFSGQAVQYLKHPYPWNK